MRNFELNSQVCFLCSFLSVFVYPFYHDYIITNFNFFTVDIYVGNLHYKVDGEALKEIFEEYGEVSAVKIVTDNVTHRSKGFAFVTMPNDSEAKQAIEELNEGELMGQKNYCKSSPA